MEAHWHDIVRRGLFKLPGIKAAYLTAPVSSAEPFSGVRRPSHHFKVQSAASENRHAPSDIRSINSETQPRPSHFFHGLVVVQEVPKELRRVTLVWEGRAGVVVQELLRVHSAPGVGCCSGVGTPLEECSS